MIVEERLACWEPVFLADGRMQSGELILEKGLNEVEVGLKVFRYARDPEQKEWAFWHLARLFWSPEEDGGLGLVRECKFYWHPWAALHVKAFAAEKYVAIGGSANSSKSYTSAAWAIISWLCDPENVLVLLTSTSIKGAQQRVWGAVDKLLTPLVNGGLAPTRVRSNGSAPYVRPNKSVSDSAGLFIVAGAKDSDRGSTGKLIGIKATPETIKLNDGRKFQRARLLVVADELSDLSMAVIEAMKTNLKSQKPQFIALSNPKGQYDAFGEMAEPEGGWDSVDLLNDHTWRTRMGGVYLRMDAEQSPNVLAGEELYDCLPTLEYVEDQKRQLGEKSAGYFRMVRAIFYAAAGGEGLYSKPEIRMAGAQDRVELIGKVTRLAALDTSESDDGDNTTAVFASLGYTKDRQHVLQFDEEVRYIIADETSDVPRPYQIMRQFRDMCVKEGMTAEQTALDDTMNQYAAILEMEWKKGTHAVNCNESASERRSVGDIQKSNRDVYASRTAEMWHEPRTLMQHKQIRGLPDKVVEQITTRKHSMGLHGTGSKVGVEPKKDYRKRTGGSPDEADAAWLVVDLAISRYGLRPGGVPEAHPEGVVPAWLEKYTGEIPLSAFDMAGRSEHAWLFL